MIVLPFVQKQKGDAMKTEGEKRNEEIKPRSINLPAWLWEALDNDAKRCKRSATKQIEALLTLCYDPGADIEIDRQKIASAFQTASQRRNKNIA